MQRYVIIGTAIVVLTIAGVIESARAIRRADPEHARAMQESLDAIPLAFGNWKAKVQEFDAKQIEQAGAKAHIFRIYQQHGRAEELQLLILAGEPGEIGAHDPQRCYAGSGFRAVGTSQRRELIDPSSGKTVSYWTARFDADTYPASSIQVVWAWTIDGYWNASNDARLEYVGQPKLYKMYVTRRLTAVDPTADSNLTDSFLIEFLPVVKKAFGVS